MNWQLRYSTLSTAYYVLCMVILTIYLCMAMQSQEHAAEPVYGMGLFTCFTFMVLAGSLLKFLLFPGYQAYKPDGTMILYLLYLCWVFVPLVLNAGSASMMDLVLMFIRSALPVFSLLVTFNYLMNHGQAPWLGWIFCGMWICLVLTYFRIMLSLMAVDDVIQMVSSYYTLFVLPLILLTTGRWRSALFLLLTMLVLMSSVKRAGIITMGAGLIVYALAYAVVSPRLKLSAVVGGLVLLLSLGGIFIAFANSEENNILERFQNMDRDEGSGRLMVWSKTVKLLEESDFGALMVGHGYDMVRQDSQAGLSAHNDFLEVAYDYGLIGLFLYVLAFSALTVKAFTAVMHRRSFAPEFALFLTIYFLLSMVSHVIVYDWGNIVLMTIGFIVVQEKMEPDAWHK